MGYDKARAAEILKTILDVSGSRRLHAEACEFEEVISLQKRRELLLRELKVDTGKEGFKQLADEIL